MQLLVSALRFSFIFKFPSFPACCLTTPFHDQQTSSYSHKKQLMKTLWTRLTIESILPTLVRKCICLSEDDTEVLGIQIWKHLLKRQQLLSHPPTLLKPHVPNLSPLCSRYDWQSVFSLLRCQNNGELMECIAVIFSNYSVLIHKSSEHKKKKIHYFYAVQRYNNLHPFIVFIQENGSQLSSHFSDNCFNHTFLGTVSFQHCLIPTKWWEHFSYCPLLCSDCQWLLSRLLPFSVSTKKKKERAQSIHFTSLEPSLK